MEKTNETMSNADILARDYEFLKSYITILANNIKQTKQHVSDIDTLLDEVENEGKSITDSSVATLLHDKIEAYNNLKQEYEAAIKQIDNILLEKDRIVNLAKKAMQTDDVAMNVNDVTSIAKRKAYIESAMAKYGSPLKTKSTQELARLESKILRMQLKRTPQKVNAK